MEAADITVYLLIFIVVCVFYIANVVSKIKNIEIHFNQVSSQLEKIENILHDIESNTS